MRRSSETSNPKNCLALLAGLAGLFSAALATSAEPARTAKSPQQCEFGMVIEAQGGGFRSFSGIVTVPADWPDQQRVRVVKEELPPGATVSYKKIEDVGRQMIVKIPLVPPGKELRAVLTFEVEPLKTPPLPQDTLHYTLPERGKLTAPHLAPSPLIESDSPEVRKAAEEAVGDRKNPWDKVKAIHQWVYQNIKHTGGQENKQSTLKTLSARIGECAEKNSLAVAMLRSQGMPARLVRIPHHCYYEVNLADGEGECHWISADASQPAPSSPNADARGMILQKGDSVWIVDPATKKRVKGRFLSESATGTPSNRGVKLRFEPVSPAMHTRAKAKPSDEG
jgi:hypothetical protein